jgi:hypothetical protein
LAAERGWRTPLGDTLPRLRCAQCGAKPATIDLLASPADDATGAASLDAAERMARRLPLTILTRFR